MKRQTKIATGAGVALAAAIAGALLLTPGELPMFAYEGDTVLGYDVPPRMYVLIEQDTHRSNLDLPECKPAAWNWPCVVYKNGETVKLHIFRCMDLRGAAKFDQESCKNQRDYDQSFVKDTP